MCTIIYIIVIISIAIFGAISPPNLEASVMCNTFVWWGYVYNKASFCYYCLLVFIDTFLSFVFFLILRITQDSRPTIALGWNIIMFQLLIFSVPGSVINLGLLETIWHFPFSLVALFLEYYQHNDFYCINLTLLSAPLCNCVLLKWAFSSLDTFYANYVWERIMRLK